SGCSGYILTIENNTATIRAHQADNRFEDRALARPVRPHHGNYLALVDLDGNIPKHLGVAIADIKAFNLKHVRSPDRAQSRRGVRQVLAVFRGPALRPDQETARDPLVR